MSELVTVGNPVRQTLGGVDELSAWWYSQR